MGINFVKYTFLNLIRVRIKADFKRLSLVTFEQLGCYNNILCRVVDNCLELSKEQSQLCEGLLSKSECFYGWVA